MPPPCSAVRRERPVLAHITSPSARPGAGAGPAGHAGWVPCLTSRPALRAGVRQPAARPPARRRPANATEPEPAVPAGRVGVPGAAGLAVPYWGRSGRSARREDREVCRPRRVVHRAGCWGSAKLCCADIRSPSGVRVRGGQAVEDPRSHQLRGFSLVQERSFRIDRVEWGRRAEKPPTPSRRVAGVGGVIAGSWWRPSTGSDHPNRKNAEPVAIEPRAKPALVSGPSARALTNRPVTTTATSSRAMATMLGVLMVI